MVSNDLSTQPLESEDRGRRSNVNGRVALAIITICGVSYKIHFVSYLLPCEKKGPGLLALSVRYLRDGVRK